MIPQYSHVTGYGLAVSTCAKIPGSAVRTLARAIAGAIALGTTVAVSATAHAGPCPDTGDCRPDPTATFCDPITCPIGQICWPVTYEQGTGDLLECECRSPNECYATYVGDNVICVGGCPTGEFCKAVEIDCDGDAHADFRCECVGVVPCTALPDGSGCSNTECPSPDPPDSCHPTEMYYDSSTGEYITLACDCGQCRVKPMPNGEAVCVTEGPDGCPDSPDECCEMNAEDTDGDGVDDTFLCECVDYSLGQNCLVLDLFDPPTCTGSCCNPSKTCLASVITSADGMMVHLDCSCDSPTACALDLSPPAPSCAGECTPGEPCLTGAYDVDGNGEDDTFACYCGLLPSDEACCLVGGSCADVPAQVCALLDGTPQGAGMTCGAPGLCEVEAPIPTVSAWSLAGLTLLVLTTGTVVLLKRRHAMVG